MTKKFGFDRLRQQIEELAAAEFDEQLAVWPECGSPIEKLLDMAISFALHHAHYGYSLVDMSPAQFEGLSPDTGTVINTILRQRQVMVEGCRVDFVFWIFGARPDGKGGWIPLVVECDGHQFHERTKEQASRDRSRDRSFQLAGHEVFRFTGSELWRDPAGCAKQVIGWVIGKACV